MTVAAAYTMSTTSMGILLSVRVPAAGAGGMGADDGRDRSSWSWEDKSIANLDELRYGAISTI